MTGIEPFISFGAVSGPQGLDGEIKVLSLSEHERRFLELPGKSVLWRRGGLMRVLTVSEVRNSGRYYVMKLAGIDSRESAMELSHGEFVIPMSELIPLPEGKYYLHQIVGLRVVDRDLGELGTVKEVLQPGSNDVCVVSGDLGEILIPALKSVVYRIDLSDGRMDVKLPEGLLSDHEN